jgi:hypothetical protein
VRLLAQDEPIAGTRFLFENGDWIVPVEERVAQLGKMLRRSTANPAFPVTFISDMLHGEPVCIRDCFVSFGLDRLLHV